MKQVNWYTRKFFKPKKLPIEVDGLKTVEFSWFPNSKTKYKIGDCFITPMQSGKKALVRIYDIWTPFDPGDQHFYRYEFIRYI